MKVIFFLTALLVVALAAEDKYTSKYDNIDLDEILNNDRLISGYLRCLLDKGRCTAEGAELKNDLIPKRPMDRCHGNSSSEYCGCLNGSIANTGARNVSVIWAYCAAVMIVLRP